MLVHFTFFTLFRYPFLSWTLTSSFSVTFGHKEKVFRSIFIQPYSFMHTLVMLLQIPCCSCGVFTFTKRIFHFFMFTLNMLFEIACCSYSVFAFITRISHYFMYTLDVSFQIPYCSCSVFKFISLFMFSLNMLF